MDLSLRAKELREILTQYQRAYYTTGRAMVSDLEYDRLFDELVKIEKEDPSLKTPDSPTLRVGSDLSSDFPEVAHTIPVLSLDKAYSADEIYSFIEKSRKTKEDLSFVLEEKIDGFSIVLYYRDGVLERAVTRGNGSVGNDVTANVKTICSVPLVLSSPQTLAVRGEIYLPVSEFDRINACMEEPYANPRNLAAGTIRRNKSSETAKVPLSIFCYEGFWEKSDFTDHIQILSELKKLGFKTNPNISLFCKTRSESVLKLKSAGLEGKALCFDDIPSDIQSRTELRKNLGYEIDGLVVKINELSVRQEMGYTDHHPRWAIAYKFTAPTAQSTLLSIDVQIGRTGRVTPMARIKSTELSGSVISNVTLHNEDYVNALEIAVGDTVAISKRGDVIPAVESVLEKNTKGNTTFRMPQRCPVCNSLIEKRGAHHFCPNRSCPAQEKGRLEFFCAKKQMDIEGLGKATLDFLYDNGYLRTLGDIFCFDYSALVRDKVEGFGVKKTSSIASSVQKAKDTDWRRSIPALGLCELGHKVMDLIHDNTDISSLDELVLKAKNKDEFCSFLESIAGIGPVTASSIANALRDEENIKIIKTLTSLGVNFTRKDSANGLEQVFAGQSWCVTGTFEHFSPRDKAMEEIKKRGGTEVSSVSSKTSCLLCGANAGSKLAKAQSLGVKIVYENEFLELLGNNIKEDNNKETKVEQLLFDY